MLISMAWEQAILAKLKKAGFWAINGLLMLLDAPGRFN